MKWSGLLRLVAMLMLLGGCASSIIGDGTPPTRFFIISPLTLSPAMAEAGSSGREIGVAVEPLLIPSYLDRPQIVIRTGGGNELFISEFNQWGESLRGNLSRVLIENLSLLLNSDRIFLMPGLKRQRPDFRAFVKIIQFERDGDGTIRLTIRWKLSDRGKKVLFRESLVLTGAKVALGDYPAIAQTMSHLLTEFAHRMVAVIQKQAVPG
jgi:uncharacterized protein